jgi:glycosyltransferase involved in cell wall biosynthesis
VPPGDADALAEAIVRVLTDKSIQQRLQRGAGSARDGRLGWPRIADLVLDS